MKRYPDWQIRFETFIASRLELPFQWGSNDCVLFAADAVEALTGEHLCPELRGHDSARAAVLALRKAGGLVAIAGRALGEPIPVAFARTGDVIAVRVGKRDALGVCNGATVIGPGPQGVVAMSMLQACVAWRVG